MNAGNDFVLFFSFFFFQKSFSTCDFPFFIYFRLRLTRVICLKLDLTDAAIAKMKIARFKCPISALPFDALKCKWSRLLPPQEAQPDGSIIK